MDSVEKTKLYDSILAAIRTELSQIRGDPASVYKIVIDNLLKIPYAIWTGIYLYNKDTRELYLGIYEGKSRKTIMIPPLKGNPGYAVAYRKSKIYDGIGSMEESLVSSAETKSEIVIMLAKDAVVLGCIDIESNEPGIFDETDLKYLQEIAETVLLKIYSF
ncbi:MAG: GAF domain-containing protein [Candidatus Odinarchaeota archaeon]